MLEALNIPLFGLTSAAIVAVLYVAGSLPVNQTHCLRDNKIWRRIVPALPVVLGAIIYTTVPLDIEGTWGARLMMGLVAGLAAAQGRKVIKRAIFDRLSDKK